MVRKSENAILGEMGLSREQRRSMQAAAEAAGPRAIENFDVNQERLAAKRDRELIEQLVREIDDEFSVGTRGMTKAELNRAHFGRNRHTRGSSTIEHRSSRPA